jgi:hypothetical protein
MPYEASGPARWAARYHRLTLTDRIVAGVAFDRFAPPLDETRPLGVGKGASAPVPRILELDRA